MEKLRKFLNLKDQRGSITLFVTIVMILFTSVGVVTYVDNQNKILNKELEVQKVQEGYLPAPSEIEDIYKEEIKEGDFFAGISLFKSSTKEAYNVNNWVAEDLDLKVEFYDDTITNKYIKITYNKGKPNETSKTYDYETEVKGKSILITDNCVIVAGDSSGNTTKVTVSKMDKVIPKIEFTGNPANWTNKDALLLGTIIETGSGIETVTINGKELEVVAGKIKYPVSKNGEYEFIAKDRAGNTGVIKVSVAKVDKENPEIVKLTNPTNGAWTASDVTVTLEAIDTLSGIDHFEWYENNTWTTNGLMTTGNTATITYTTEMDKTIRFRVVDKAGNISEEATTVIKINKTLPKIEITGNPTDWTNKDIILNVDASDDVTGIKSLTVNGTPINITDGNTTYPVTENGTYNFIITNNVGNTFTEIVVVDKIDKGNPNLEVTGNPKEWTKDDVTLTIKASDDLSGVESVTVNGVPIAITDDETTYTVTENGTYTIVVTDKAENTTTEKITVDKIDKKAPVIEVTGNPTEWTKEDVTLTIKASDGESGLKNVTVNGTAITLNNGQASYPVSSNGTYTFVATDNVGNTTTRTITVNKIDKTSPTVALGTNGGTYTITPGNTTVNLTTKLTATDDGGSGLSSTLKYQFSTSTTIPAESDTNWRIFTNQETVSVAKSGGTYYLYTYVTDVAGNRATDVQKSNPFIVNYQITYNANGGSGAPEAQNKTHGTTLTLSSTKPERVGYTFKGWGTSASATTVSYAAGANYTNNAAIALYAIWEINSYTATFDANEGTTANPATITKNYGEQLGTLPTTSRVGYNFKGWYTEKTGGTKIETTTTMPSNNVTYYAQWDINSYTLTVNPNGGTWNNTTANSTFTQQYNTTKVIDNPNVPAGDKVTFNGNGGSNPEVITSTKSFVNWSKEGEGTLNGTTYTFGAGNGTLTANYKNNSITLPTSTRTGYNFNGWYTAATGGTKVGDGGATYTPTVATTLYAQWTANTYTVKYDGNGATGGSTANSSHTYDVAKSLTANGYKRDYTVTYNHNYTGSTNTTKTATYTFNGWATSANGAKVYDDKQSVTNLSSTKGATVTLYANWTSASVNYTPTRTGYTFEGWYKEAACTNKISDATYTPTANITLYAKWTVKSYTVTYNYSENGGKSATKTSASVNYGSAVDLTPTAIKEGDTGTYSTSNPDGWKFIGWNTNKDATTALTSYTMSDSNVTLYAIYSKTITATGHYYNNKSQNVSVTVYNKTTSATVKLPTIANQTVSNVTYTARGWSTSTEANANNPIASAGSVTISEDTQYYASYQATITGTFYYCTLAADNYTYTGAEQSSKTATAIKYMGYTGEYTNSNYTVPTEVTGSTGGASAEEYKGVATAINSPTIVTPTTASTTFYAVYTETLTFYYYNGSAHTSKAVTRRMLSNGVSYSNSLSETVTPSAYDSASFVAWTYDNTKYDESYRRNPLQTGTNSLYAIYQKTVTLSYDENGGSGAPSSQSGTKTYVSKSEGVNTYSPTLIISSTKPTKTGYTFIEWNTKADGTGTKYASEASIQLDANVTLCAMFRVIIPPTVDISPNGGTYNIKRYQEFLTYKDKDKLDNEWAFSATGTKDTSYYYYNPYGMFDESKIQMNISYDYTGAIFSNQKVDVTNMNTLVLRCYMYDNASSNSYINKTSFGLSKDNTTINGNWIKCSTEEYVASLETGHATGNPKAEYKEFVIDVSDLTGEYYIQLAVQHVSPDAYTAITIIEDMYATYSQYLPTTISTTLTATDGEGSGLNKLEYAWSTSDTAEPTTWETFTNGQTITRIVTGEKLYLWTNVIDSMGNKAISIKTSKAFTPNEIKYEKYKVTLMAPRKHAGTTWIRDIGERVYICNKGTTFNISDYINAFTAPPGYQYGGANTDDWWNVGSDGSQQNYTSNSNNGGSSTFTVTGDMVAQLHYYPITYTINYNGNGATSGSTASSSHTYDVAKKLTANGFSKTGYTFSCWNTKADGTGINYSNSQSISNLTTTNGETITLYARWTDNIAPTITVSPTSATACKSKSVKITVADTGSGLNSSNSYQYYLSTSSTALSGGAWTNYTSGTAFTLGSGKTGTYYLFVKRITDVAGNTSTTNGTATTVSNVVYQRFGSYVFDNTAPTLGIGSTIKYNMRNGSSPNYTNAVTTGTNTTCKYPAFPETNFTVSMTNNEKVTSLLYRISTQNVTNYDNVTTGTAKSGSWSDVSATTKTVTVSLTSNDSTTPKTYYIYLKGTDSAGNVGYAKKTMTVYTKYQAFVVRAYYNALDRVPDATGFSAWTTALYNGIKNNTFSAYVPNDWALFSSTITGNQKYKSMALALRGLFWSDEFVEKNYNNTEFVRRLYRTILLREPDSSGLTNWVNDLNNGKSREQAIADMASTTEAINTYNNSYGL